MVPLFTMCSVWMSLYVVVQFYPGGDSSNKCCLSRTMCKQKSSKKNWNIIPNFWETFLKKSQTSQNFTFITSCLPENFPILLIPSKVFRFSEEFVFLPQQPFLELTLLSSVQNFIPLCFKLIIIPYHTQKTKEIIFEPRTNLIEVQCIQI